MKFDLSTLNPEQLKPVLDTEGAVLVTAGAGSGKTRLLTHRIAYIIDRGMAARYNILAITFTNKAAGEMKERLCDMVENADDIWIFTFHALCVRILRRYIGFFPGFTPNFSIYGENEKNNCIKRILRELADKGKIKAAADFEKIAAAAVSKAKEAGLTPDDYLAINKFARNIDVIYDVYKRYEQIKMQSNALDYDDLLLYARDLLNGCDEAREYYCNKFRYIHIDEFQDTNAVQYEIASILAGKWGNIFAVGDEDQSIYGWRGADYRNIFNFQRDFNCKIYKLEQNYRSTQNILDVANKVIANNTERLEKVLWTANARGSQVDCHCAENEREEVNYVVRRISRLMSEEGYSYGDFAVLMRVNSLSRPFEEAFLSYNVPYRVYGGFKFYERKEIKDVLAYLKLMVNPSDNEALLRIINFPRRGIGEATAAQLVNYAQVTGKSLFDAVTGSDKDDDLPPKLVKKLANLSETLKCFKNAYESLFAAQRVAGAGVAELGKYIVKVLNLKEYYGGDDEDDVNRRMNVKELLNGMEEFDRTNGGTPDEYLQSISLYSDTDEESGDGITVSTVHSAKGLEFKTVFIVGAEEGIFPSTMAIDEGGIEEERRLMYVAITRAMENLIITYTRSRFRFNQISANMPSRFLTEAGFNVSGAGAAERKKAEYSRYYADGAAYDYRAGRYGGGYAQSDFYGRSEPASERGVPAAKKDFSRFKPGVRVCHAKFGEGEIVSLDGDGEGLCARVAFDKCGTLNLMLMYAPLEIKED